MALHLVVASLVLGVLASVSAQEECIPASGGVASGLANLTIVPIELAASCLESVKVDGKAASSEVRAVDSIFSMGYAYYTYNNDVLASEPISAPPGGANWAIHTGPGGGQVNYQEAFGSLEDRIRQQEHGDLMLAYEIQDILLRARDAHTAPHPVPLALVIYAPGEGGVRLSLRQRDDGSGDIDVITVSQSEGTKVVSSINGEDPIAFLKELTANTGLGPSTKFKSEGVRLNEFLASFNGLSEDIVWAGRTPGDFRKLPPSLEIAYADGSTTTWSFGVLAPSDLVGVPGDVLRNAFFDGPRAKSPILAAYGILMDNLDEEPMHYPGYKEARSADNGLNFTTFSDKTGNMYSAYAVYDDGDEKVMIWKLPSFGNIAGVENHQLTFWNAMTAAANEQGVSKLLIDISGNGGGNIDYAFRNLFLLFQDADPEDVVHKFRVRITPVLQALWKAWDREQEIWDALLNGDEDDLRDLIDFLDDKVAQGDLIDAFDHYTALSAFSKELSTASEMSLNNRLYFYAEFLALSRVSQLVEQLASSGVDVTDEQVEALLRNLQKALNPPQFCAFNPGACHEMDSLFTETLNAGGVTGTWTVPLYMGQFTTIPNMDITKLDVVDIAVNATASPFDEIILVSVGIDALSLTPATRSPTRSPTHSHAHSCHALRARSLARSSVLQDSSGVGSAANMFESGLRSLGYLGKSQGLSGPLWPAVTGVSMGCFGPSECEMSQFQGIIDDGASVASRLYSAVMPLDGLRDLLHLIPPEYLERFGLSEDDVVEFDALVDAYADLLPEPSMTVGVDRPTDVRSTQLSLALRPSFVRSPGRVNVCQCCHLSSRRHQHGASGVLRPPGGGLAAPLARAWCHVGQQHRLPPRGLRRRPQSRRSQGGVPVTRVYEIV